MFLCECVPPLLVSNFSIYVRHKVNFLNEQNKFNFYTSFHQFIYSGFLRCEAKCSSQQQIGIVLETFILNKLFVHLLKLLINLIDVMVL